MSAASRWFRQRNTYWSLTDKSILEITSHKKCSIQTTSFSNIQPIFAFPRPHQAYPLEMVS